MRLPPFHDRLQAAPQRGQFRDLPVELDQLPGRELIYLPAWRPAAIANAQNARQFLEAEPHAQRAAHQPDAMDRFRRILPVPGRRSSRARQHSQPLIVPQGVCAHAR